MRGFLDDGTGDSMQRLHGWLIRFGLVLLAVGGLGTAAGVLVYPEVAVGTTPRDWARALRHDWASVRSEARERLLDAGAASVDPLADVIREHPDAQYEAFRLLSEMYLVGDAVTIERVESTLRELESSGGRRIRGQVLACYARVRDPRERWQVERCRKRGVIFRGLPDDRPGNDPRAAYPFTAIVGDAWGGSDHDFAMLGDIARLEILQVRSDARVSEEAVRAIEERRPRLAVVRRGTACIGIAGRMPRPPYSSLRVLGIDPDSGAAAAGLRVWDRIVYVDGSRIDAEADLYEQLVDAEPGDRVRTLLLRDFVWTWVEVELGREDARGYCRCGESAEDLTRLPTALPDF